jgi:hypothetical protein
VIGQVLKRGRSVRGLLYYLFTEGQAGEKGLDSAHTDARVIAGWDAADSLASLQPPVCAGGRRDFQALASALNQPVVALGLAREELRKLKPVYHLAISAAKDPQTGQLVDRRLDDAQWADIAREYMDRMGLAPRGDDSGVRWVAVRHADDHVHIVATLARQDGRRPRLFNDHYRSMEASRFVEAKYGLTVTGATGRTGAPRASRAEQRKHRSTAQRRREQGAAGPAAPDRDVLRRQVRTAAAGASSLPEFLARLRGDGLLVRERMSERNPGEITGYAVALPDRYDAGGKPIYFGGGKLAPDLSLPQLQRRWQGAGAGRQSTTGPAAAAASRGAGSGPQAGGRQVRSDRFGLTEIERLRIWKQATLAARTASEHIAASVADNPAAAADAAWAASDFLAAAGRVVEGRAGGPLTDAAQQYDHAAREMFGRTPAPTAAGTGLRVAGRLLLSAQVAKPSELRQLLALLAQLSALTDAVTRLRETQQRAAQAQAARRAAEQLRDLTAGYSRSQAPLVGVAPATAHGRTYPSATSDLPVQPPLQPSRGPRR